MSCILVHQQGGLSDSWGIGRMSFHRTARLKIEFVRRWLGLLFGMVMRGYDVWGLSQPSPDRAQSE